VALEGWLVTLPIPGPGRPHHPGQFRQPPTERQLEHARAARAVLERRPRPRGLRRFNPFGLRRAARKGGRF